MDTSSAACPGPSGPAMSASRAITSLLISEAKAIRHRSYSLLSLGSSHFANWFPSQAPSDSGGVVCFAFSVIYAARGARCSHWFVNYCDTSGDARPADWACNLLVEPFAYVVQPCALKVLMLFICSKASQAGRTDEQRQATRVPSIAMWYFVHVHGMLNWIRRAE